MYKYNIPIYLNFIVIIIIIVDFTIIFVDNIKKCTKPQNHPEILTKIRFNVLLTHKYRVKYVRLVNSVVEINLMETGVGQNSIWWKRERHTFGGHVLRPL